MAEMSPKVAAKAFWVGEVEMELRRLTKEDFRFHADKDLGLRIFAENPFILTLSPTVRKNASLEVYIF